ncbi:uncharacterized protein LOC113462425 isoform X1 [Phoenix dactylifera]|uniref:Uncharacterized protein LOC113462425 isoform X1 n=1 Tax=Phoenix dactylifera TaxID=42345 RepID=A0A8B8J1C9_PHODC|nr:uncharacterized protein LOC113462425 isoform X1 [Phoenix dactylifera]
MTILCFLILAAFFTKVGCGKAEGESGCWRMNRWEDKGTSYLLTQNAQHSNARLIDSCLLSKELEIFWKYGLVSFSTFAEQGWKFLSVSFYCALLIHSRTCKATFSQSKLT